MIRSCPISMSPNVVEMTAKQARIEHDRRVLEGELHLARQPFTGDPDPGWEVRSPGVVSLSLVARKHAFVAGTDVREELPASQEVCFKRKRSTSRDSSVGGRCEMDDRRSQLSK